MKKRKVLYRLLFSTIVTLFVIIYFLLHKKEVESMQIYSFYVINKIDSTIIEPGNRFSYREDNFLVVGFINYEKNIHDIDSFVCSKSIEIDTILKKYSNYTMCFYIKNKTINNNYDEKNESEWDWNGYYIRDNLICIYMWHDEYFLTRHDPDYKYVLDTLVCK